MFLIAHPQFFKPRLLSIDRNPIDIPKTKDEYIEIVELHQELTCQFLETDDLNTMEQIHRKCQGLLKQMFAYEKFILANLPSKDPEIDKTPCAKKE